MFTCFLVSFPNCYKQSFFTILGLVGLKFGNDEVNRAENVLIEFSIAVFLQHFILMLFNPSAYHGLNCFLRHSQGFVESIIITLLVIGAHLLLLNVPLEILLLQFVNDLLLLESFLVFGDFL